MVQFNRTNRGSITVPTVPTATRLRKHLPLASTEQALEIELERDTRKVYTENIPLPDEGLTG